MLNQDGDGSLIPEIPASLFLGFANGSTTGHIPREGGEAGVRRFDYQRVASQSHFKPAFFSIAVTAGRTASVASLSARSTGGGAGWRLRLARIVTGNGYAFPGLMSWAATSMPMPIQYRREMRLH